MFTGIHYTCVSIYNQYASQLYFHFYAIFGFTYCWCTHLFMIFFIFFEYLLNFFTSFASCAKLSQYHFSIQSDASEDPSAPFTLFSVTASSHHSRAPRGCCALWICFVSLVSPFPSVVSFLLPRTQVFSPSQFPPPHFVEICLPVVSWERFQRLPWWPSN